tara:strand:- start:701 stop:1792 length:1092 start_codon:yes stop_codon:yes gene_type:complete
MHYYIISGELSGDIYGSHLIEYIKQNDENAEFTCWGGEHMKHKGAKLVRDLNSLAFMGFLEVLKNFKTIFKNYFFAKKNIKDLRPDAIILIDYPGFNLRIAKYAKKLNIPVYWFIAPQTWAWKDNRNNTLRKYVDKLFVALPFELNYFQNAGIQTFYYGHPLMNVIKDHINQEPPKALGKPVIALLPGSRKQEIETMLPIMLQIVDRFLNYRFIVVGANSIKRSFYEKFIDSYNVELNFNKEVLNSVHAAVTTSGTVTLEIAAYKIPQVVCYKLNQISYFIARAFAKVKYIALVNLLANEMLVKELIQGEFNADNIERELNQILDSNNRNNIITKYNQVMSELYKPDCFNNISKTIHGDLLKK